MSSYTNPLDTRYLPTSDNWSVLTPFTYFVGHEDSNERIDIPAGFVTDGASVPQPFWSIIPPWGQYGQAAVVHDFLCEHLFTKVSGVPTKITRKRADQIFLEAMEVLQVPAWKRLSMYAAVRAYATLTGKR